MRTLAAALGGLGAIHLCWATTLSVIAQKAVVDRAFDAAVQGEHRAEALEVLESIADGKPREILIAAATKAGVRVYVDDSLPTDLLRTRRYALERIGEMDLPETVQYLQSLTQGHVGPDNSRTIYPNAKLALQKALFRREKDPQQQIVFLERKIKEPSGYLVAMWAADELCDRGSTASASVIGDFIRKRYSGQSGDEMVTFCQARTEIINRNPNRAIALGSALRIDASFQDQRIIGWAIGQLTALHSEEADAVLDRYVTEVETKLPDTPAVTSAPKNVMHIGFSRDIRLEQAVRKGMRSTGTVDASAAQKRER